MANKSILSPLFSSPPPLQVTTSYEQLQATKKEQETELTELRQNKELLTQWEQQIADIIQWVTEEKDARSYLKSMAKKLADDVEGLKSTASTMNRVRGYNIAQTSRHTGRVLCLECRVSWVRVPPEAALFFLEK